MEKLIILNLVRPQFSLPRMSSQWPNLLSDNNMVSSKRAVDQDRIGRELDKNWGQETGCWSDHLYPPFCSDPRARHWLQWSGGPCQAGAIMMQVSINVQNFITKSIHTSSQIGNSGRIFLSLLPVLWSPSPISAHSSSLTPATWSPRHLYNMTTSGSGLRSQYNKQFQK